MTEDELRQKHSVASEDIELFHATCRQYGTFLIADALVKEKGEFLEDSYGKLYSSPALAVRDKAYDKFISGMKQLKLTPASRSQNKQLDADVDILEGL
jgi:P27 family predicted phage terminase small subunit